MKKIFKYFMMVVVAISGLSLASCSDDDDNYTIGEQSDGAYIYSSFSSKTFKPEDAQTFSITLGRTNTSADATYDLKCDNEIFTAPTKVTFKAGEKEVAVPVTCNLELGQTESVMFTIPTKESSVYGDDTLSVTIARDYTWEKVGEAKFTDNVFFGLEATVDVMKAKEGTNLYKFACPLTTAFKQAGEEELPGEADIKFTMDEEGNVSMEDGIYDVETGTSFTADSNCSLYQFYYRSTGDLASYCSFTNDNGTFTFVPLLLMDGNGLDPCDGWNFIWTKGYPFNNDNSDEDTDNGSN